MRIDKRPHCRCCAPHNWLGALNAAPVRLVTRVLLGPSSAPFGVGTSFFLTFYNVVVLMPHLQEGFEQQVFDGAWSLFESFTVQNVLVEVKRCNAPEKSALLAKIMQAGGFKRAYDYREVYWKGEAHPK